VSLSSLFAALRERGATAFCPYLTVGYPNVAASIRWAENASRLGVQVIEVGVPFSDPQADGPTIQAASQVALEAGVRLHDAFAMVEAIRGAGSALPVMMSYYNPIHALGEGPFIKRAAAAGAAGLIVPDLPLEESARLRRLAAEEGLDLIALIAPTSPDHRIAKIASAATGFLYLVAVTGVTGSRWRGGGELASYVDRVRAWTALPLCVGFGISSPADAAEVARVADGVIVGSALTQCLREALAMGGEGAADEAFRNLVVDFGKAVES
jgi:tryptophan synthase alpha chain